MPLHQAVCRSSADDALTQHNKFTSAMPFWAQDRASERQAFEAFMDFVTARLAAHPHAHVYHYAHYEETALKRLMTLHATREA